MKKNLVTFFSLTDNLHLIKDVGTIPNTLARDFGWYSTLVCFDREQNLDYSKTIASSMCILKIPYPSKYRFGQISISPLSFILKNARKIAVLQLYHLSPETKAISTFYKILNPLGKVYIKMDTDAQQLQEQLNRTSHPSFLKNMVRRLQHWKLQKYIELIPNILTVETKATHSLALSLYPHANKKIHLLPNGIDTHWLQTNGFEHPSPTEKENIIITVGRIGTHQKNNEMMLQALHNLELGDWKFVFIGSIEDDFKSKIEQFYANNPSMRSKVIFTGNIDDRMELYSWYKKAKVFCLTSRYESWCLAMGDALYFGCEIVSTPISSLPDLTDNGSFGYVVNNAEELKIVIQKLVSENINPLQSMDKITQHSENFSWSKICEKLEALL